MSPPASERAEQTTRDVQTTPRVAPQPRGADGAARHPYLALHTYPYGAGRVRERGAKYEIVFRQCFQGFPLSPALSPLVPRGEREKPKRRLLPVPLSPILRTPVYVEIC